MKLIVGIGNPTKEYDKTRHNVGFMALDHYLPSEKWSKQFDSLVFSKIVNEERVLFMKPLTYVNLSGKAVFKAASYYKIVPEDIMVIHDDLDLPFETIRLKKNSGSGGHNGIKSIIDLLGTKSFLQLKIGISHVDKSQTIDYVLGHFSKKEQEKLEDIFLLSDKAIDLFISSGSERAICEFNEVIK